MPEPEKFKSQQDDHYEKMVKVIEPERNDDPSTQLSHATTANAIHTNWSLKDIVFNWKLAYKSCLLAMFLHFTQQMSGINAIFYYSNTLYEDPKIPLLIVSLNLVATILGIIITDHCVRYYLSLIL